MTEARDLAARAARVLPGGVTHAARAYAPALYVVRAQGSRKWLVDGRELVDYTMGHGALLLGHAHPEVVAAVRRQAGDGTHFGAGSPLEVEWAERIAALVESVAMVRFTASGTEAAMLSLRVARAATGREVVVKLDGHFHGWSDGVSVNLAAGRIEAGAGVAAGTARSTRVVPAGDLDALRDAIEPGDVAAVILEASGAHYGQVPLPDGYVAEALRLARAAGAVSIVDEVVTGFRVAPGGLQGVLGVRPDLTLFGKVMAGGLPGGALGGRSDLMDLLATRIVHPGTFNANPLTATAGIVTLRICSDGAPQARASAFAGELESAWREVLDRSGTPGRVWRLASIVHLALDDPQRHAALAGDLRAAGVDLLHSSAFCSAVHTDEDLDRSVEALGRVVGRVTA